MRTTHAHPDERTHARVPATPTACDWIVAVAAAAAGDRLQHLVDSVPKRSCYVMMSQAEDRVEFEKLAELSAERRTPGRVRREGRTHVAVRAVHGARLPRSPSPIRQESDSNSRAGAECVACKLQLLLA